MSRATRFYVVGDTGQATLVYMEDGFDRHAPSRRRSWRQPRKIHRFTTPGAPGTVVRMLRELDNEADAPANPRGNAESVYILTPDDSHLSANWPWSIPSSRARSWI